MFKYKNKSNKKGMLFAGCSFTWGQGLYYYSNLSTLNEPPPDKYYAHYIRPAHIKFMESNRFPRLVANHFNTWEFVTKYNGGSNLGAVEWWNRHFYNQPHNDLGRMQQEILDFSEIDTVIFQFTQTFRDNISFPIDLQGTPFTILESFGHVLFLESNMYKELDIKKLTGKTLRELYIDYLEKNNLTFEDEFLKFTKENIMKVKEWLINLENKGLKTFVITWPDNCVDVIENDNFLNNRFIPLHYKGKIYKSIETLMSDKNLEMTIKTDFENFEETPKDHHPSLTCHSIIADNIIKFLENKNV